eukprot:scaffold20957_cov144-Skeletonema_menzelii.AAC.9
MDQPIQIQITTLLRTSCCFNDVVTTILELWVLFICWVRVSSVCHRIFLSFFPLSSLPRDKARGPPRFAVAWPVVLGMCALVLGYYQRWAEKLLITKYKVTYDAEAKRIVPGTFEICSSSDNVLPYYRRKVSLNHIDRVTRHNMMWSWQTTQSGLIRSSM